MTEKLREAMRAFECAPRGEHLSDSQWESLACGDDRDERERALDHILECQQCAKIHQALLVLQDNAHSFDPGAPEPAKSSGKSWHLWFFSGFLAVAASVLLVVLPPFSRTSLSPEPAPEAGLLLRSSAQEQSASLLAPVGRVPMADIVFSWVPAADSPVSIVQLIDDSGELVWTSEETESASMTWPSEVHMRPGRFYWRVVSSGRAIAGERASDLVAFDVTPN